ncbi:mobility group protein 1B-like [Drosophila eugracilis]|uniref:mobility group protein 1B-like n=1 Tax=Drosophila eugracilis TaxID=29029 RepID=UPI001BDA7FA9|nr:mobility group protein 1B-like [Drosophila eugracilis]
MSHCDTHLKKPMSSFLMWLNYSGREQIKTENPDLSVREVCVKGGEVWRGMTIEEKSYWQESANEAMGKYKEVKKLQKSQRELELKTQFGGNVDGDEDQSKEPKLYVYNTTDESYYPICRKCFFKCQNSN